MAVTVAELDALPPARAAELLAACCGAPRWVARMVERRPFGSVHVLLAAADEIWRTMDETDIRAAFAHHPRIGERTGDVAQNERGAAWSAREQSGVDDADADVRTALAAVNRDYEQRFGYIHIVCATGKTAGEMLALARERLRHTPENELLVAAEEQRKIMRLRLEKLLANSTPVEERT